MSKQFLFPIFSLILMFSSSLLFSLSEEDRSLADAGLKPFNEALELLWAGGSSNVPELLKVAEVFFYLIQANDKLGETDMGEYWHNKATSLYPSNPMLMD